MKSLALFIIIFFTQFVSAKGSLFTAEKKLQLDILVKQLLDENPDNITVRYTQEEHILNKVIYLEKSEYLIVYLQRTPPNLYLYQNVKKKDFLPLMNRENASHHWGKVITRDPKFKVEVIQ